MSNMVTKIINALFLLILLITSTSSIIIASSIVEIDNLIYLDPGHGGPDGGAEGINDVFEKDIVFKVCIKLKEYLNRAGYNVLLTRDGDYDLAPDDSKNRKRDDIHERVRRINESRCLLYVSIHANIYSSPKIYGAQVFYNKTNEKSKLLAEEIQETITAILQNTNRKARSINDKYLIENSKPLGCLVEIGFLSNPNEVILLQDAYYQEKMAYAIYLGISSFLDKN